MAAATRRRRLLCSVLSGVLLVLSLTVGATPTANAATIGIGSIFGAVSDQVGDSGTPAENCIRYSPITGPGASATSSALVKYPTEARTAHGFSASCPDQLDTSQQSALGITPSTVSSVTDGTPFLLGRAVHYNNPVAPVAATYTGVLKLQLSAFDAAASTVTFGWFLWETPNEASPCAFPGAGALNSKGCADEIKFASQISDDVVTKNGVSYKVVINGFDPVPTGSNCPAKPGTGTAQPDNDFLTAEQTTSASCVYATLVQVRSLTVVKKVVVPSGVTVPDFGFSSTSNLDGSPWAASSFSLTPNSPDASVTRQLVQGESVTVSETPPTENRWSLTGLACVNGDGSPFAAATYDVATGKLIIGATPAPPSEAAGPITCTFTNTYIARGTLTLVKEVTSGPAEPADWTLKAAGDTPISGAGGSAAVTDQQVSAGTYALSESGPLGYAADPWSCTGASTSGADGTVRIADGQTVVCTVRNHLATGTFTVSKTVVDPQHGFTGDADTAFAGTYQCGGAAAVAFTVSTRTPFVSPALPAGTVCTIAETTPTGHLRDGSYAWSPPRYAPGDSLTIVDRQTTATAITNTVTQGMGSLRIGKVVAPRSGTPAAGYTGGTARAFPVTYTCRINDRTVASGTVGVTQARPVTVSGVPASAVCTFTEQLQAAPGDFAGPSYTWDGEDFAPASVTVAADRTAETTVTNHFVRQFASLVLTKTVDGPGYVGTGTPFDVSVDCGFGPTVVHLADGGRATVPVPANSNCSVVETRPAESLLSPAYDWRGPVYTGLTDGSVAVPIGGTRTVGVTNRTLPVFGTVAVTKAITPAAAASAVASGTTFAVTMSCDAAAQDTTGDYRHVFTLGVGQTGTSPNLPVGTSCTVTEAAPSGSAGLVDGSYQWGAGPAAQTVTVNTRDTVRTVTVTNTVTRAYGSLDIAKSVTALNGVDGATTAFSGTWSCRYGSDAVVSGTWRRTGAGPATLTGLPAAGLLIGSTCTVAERSPSPARPNSGDATYFWGAATITSPVTLTSAAPDATVTVTNPVRRQTSDLVVSKMVSGGSAGVAYANDAFTFSYTCTPPGGGPAVSGTLSAKAGQSAGVPDGTTIPAGSSCTVTEAPNPAAIDPYRWDPTVVFTVSGASGTTSGRTVTFTTGADRAPVMVEVRNTIRARTATVTVGKTVVDPDGGFTDPTVTFAVSVICNGISYGTQNVRAGGTVTFTGLPVGATCRVVEGTIPVGQGLKDGSYAWSSSPTVSPGTITLTTPDGTYAFDVTNTVVRARTPLVVTKTVNQGRYTGVVDPNRVYTGTWTCRYRDEAPLTGTWTRRGSTTTTLTGPYTSVLLASTCTATEDDLGPVSATDPSFYWLPPVVTPVTLRAGGPNAVAVVNAIGRRTGTVRVTKTLTGETDGYVGTGAAFTVGYRCSLTDPATPPYLDGEVHVAAGATDSSMVVPVGWTCRFTEVAPGADLLRDGSYAWRAPTITVDGAASSTVKIDADGATVGVANPIDRLTGGITVSKAYAGTTPAGAIKPSATFSGGYSCLYAKGTAAAQTFTGTWSVTGTGRATLTPDPVLPLGTSCTVTEQAPSTADLAPSYAWFGPKLPAAVTVTNTADKPNLAVVNTVYRVYSQLTVTKRSSGPVGAFAAGTTVTGSWSCRLAGADIAAGRWTLPAAGGSVRIFAANGTIRQNGVPLLVPEGATCTVTEDTLSDSALTDGSYGWLPATYTPTDGVVTTALGQDRTVTVTNTTERVFGTLSVTKVIAGAGPVDFPAVFGGTYTCRHGSDAAVTGPWQITDAGSVSVTGLLVGSVCRTTEDTPAPPVAGDDSFVWLPAVISPESATVTRPEAPAQAALTITNTAQRVTGSFGITKALAGATAGQPAGQTYSFDYRCVARNGDVTAGTSTPIPVAGVWNAPGGIPVGARCTVSERPLPTLPDRTYSWGPVAYAVSGVGENGVDATAARVVFTLPGSGADAGAGSPLVTVRNTLERHAGSVRLTKALSGATAGYRSGTFAIGLSCWSPGTNPASDPPDLARTVALAPRASTTVGGILLGSACRVAEDVGSRPALADPSYAWGTPAYTVGGTAGTTFTVSSEQTPVAVVVTNPITRGSGSFTVSKTVTGTGAAKGLPVDAAFAFGYSCTVPGVAAPVTGTLRVASGGSESYDGATVLAAGSSCTVTEPETSLPDLARGYQWGDVTFTVDGAPVLPGTRSATFTVGTGTDVAVGASNDLQRVAGSYSVTKAATPPTGSAVRVGDTITYTVTVTPDGNGPVDDVVVTDDLAQVTPYATYVTGSIDAEQGAASISGNTLTWSLGTVDGTEPRTLSYAYTVDDDALGATLHNSVTVTGEQPPTSCDPCATTHTVPVQWTAWKTADPADGSRVRPGDVITYTLHVHNSSTLAPLSGVVVTDNLTDVLPYATFGSVLDPHSGTAELAGTTLTWTPGPVGPDAIELLQFTVRVDDGAYGATLSNRLTAKGPVPPTHCVVGSQSLPRGKKPVRARAEEDPATCTTTHTTPPRWTVVKTSDPVSGSVVEPGSTITYSLHVRNYSTLGPVAGVVVTDDLSDVLPHATFGAIDPTHVGTAERTGNTLTWTIGDLAAGADETLSYTVTVNVDALGVRLRNVITGTSPKVPPDTCAPDHGEDADCTTTHTTPGRWTVQKVASPDSGSTVQPGSTVTYTLEASAQSEATGVVLTDDLSELLPYVSFVGIDPDHVGTATRDGDTLTWDVGTMAGGDSDTLHYTVRVNDDAWDVNVHNLVTGKATEVPPDHCATRTVDDPDCVTDHDTPPKPGGHHSRHPHHHHSATPTPTPHHPSSGLPNTGATAATTPMLLIGGTLLLLGGMLLVVARLRGGGRRR